MPTATSTGFVPPREDYRPCYQLKKKVARATTSVPEFVSPRQMPVAI